MTDYVISNGVVTNPPVKHYGAHFVGTRATFCEDADLASMSANVLAIPGLSVTQIKASTVSVPASFFGMSVKKRSNDNLSEITFSSTRSHDMEGGKGRWQYIETSDNVWDFHDLDMWVNAHHAAGRDLVFTLFGTPSWASARPTEKNAYSDHGSEPWPYNRGIAAEPLDMSKWDRFCSKVATRYLGKIKYYEVWNEPNLSNDGAGATGEYSFFSGTYAKLSEMVRRANQAIKAVDPTAMIVCPATTAWSASAGSDGENFFAGMMAASSGDVGNTPMKNWVDIVGVHLYGWGRHSISLAGIIDRINAAKSSLGVSSMEIWDTESAPFSPDAGDLDDAQLSRLAERSWITMAAKGVARTFYYQYDHPTMGITGRTHVIARIQKLRERLINGEITSAAKFSDGRVAYYTAEGLTII